MVMVLMRQNLHELPDLVRFAAEWEMEALFVQHLCHDFGEETLPAHYGPMREFVQSQTLLEDDPVRVEHFFGLARETAEALGVDLRLPRTSPRTHPPGTPGRKRCSWPWSGGYVSYTGDVMPCCMVSRPTGPTWATCSTTAWSRSGMVTSSTPSATGSPRMSRRTSANLAPSTRASSKERTQARWQGPTSCCQRAIGWHRW